MIKTKAIEKRIVAFERGKIELHFPCFEFARASLHHLEILIFRQLRRTPRSSISWHKTGSFRSEPFYTNSLKMGAVVMGYIRKRNEWATRINKDGWDRSILTCARPERKWREVHNYLPWESRGSRILSFHKDNEVLPRTAHRDKSNR